MAASEPVRGFEVRLLGNQVGVAEFLDRLFRYADHVEMNDRPTARTVDDFDDPREERIVSVAGYHDSADCPARSRSRWTLCRRFSRVEGAQWRR